MPFENYLPRPPVITVPGCKKDKSASFYCIYLIRVSSLTVILIFQGYQVLAQTADTTLLQPTLDSLLLISVNRIISIGDSSLHLQKEKVMEQVHADSTLLSKKTVTHDLKSLAEKASVSLKDSLTHSLGGISPLSLRDLKELHAKPVSDLHGTGCVYFSYLPSLDSGLLNSGVTKYYALNISATIFGLPVSGAWSIENNPVFSHGEPFNLNQYTFSFDYRTFLANYKNQILDTYKNKLEAPFAYFKLMNYQDSLDIFNRLKDTLNNIDYQVYVNRLKDESVALEDSLKEGHIVDSCRIDEINSALEEYQTMNEEFGKLMHFQEYYFRAKSEYEKYEAEVNDMAQKAGNLSDPEELQSFASDLGVKVPDVSWPLKLKALRFGSQVLDLSSLTFDNYISSGLYTEYGDKKTIYRLGILNNKLETHVFEYLSSDSIVNPFAGSQNVYLGSYGRGDTSSSYVIANIALVREGESSYAGVVQNSGSGNWIFSLQEGTKWQSGLFARAEIANSVRLDPSTGTATESLPARNFVQKSGATGTLGYQIEKTHTQWTASVFVIGQGYFTLGNPFLQPGTSTVSCGFSQQFFKQTVHLSYNIDYRKSLSDPNNQEHFIYHVAEADWHYKDFLTLECMVSPFAFSYYNAPDRVSNNAHSNFINANITGLLPAGKNPITVSVNYSNYGSQSYSEDTLISFSTDHISGMVQGTVFTRQWTLYTDYFLPHRKTHDAVFFVNSCALTCTIWNATNFYLDAGPKWIAYGNGPWMPGGTLGLNATIAKKILWNLQAEKYIPQPGMDTPLSSTLYLNTGVTITL